MSSPQPSAPASFSQGYTPNSSRPARKEILNYSAPWPVYGLDWSNQPSEREALRMAVGSFIEDGSNKIQVITLPEFASIEGTDYSPTSMSDWVPIAETNHQYPVTKISWEPYKSGHRSFDLLATTGDYLRLWELKDETEHAVRNSSNSVGHRAPYTNRQQLVQRAVLANTKANFCAPLTSFDWNTFDPSLIVTSSIDTTCTVWNVETQQAKTQLIAHDKEVYDVTFAGNNADIFASVGADGSVRLFDLRALEHSTIIYETSSTLTPTMSKNPSPGAPPQTAPLLRIAFNKLDPNYLSTFHMDSSSVQILDIRVPGMPVSDLRGHKGSVNCMSWSPIGSTEIATGSDDHQVFIWEVSQMRNERGDDLQQTRAPRSPATGTRILHEPFRAANVGGEVNQLAWSSASPDWIAVGFGRTVQALRL
ncbi:ddb1 and cul4 associated factor 7 [Podila humilis]|nr:ddb1 and cul4 associated factor 7 [Podila humilis]